MKTFEYKILKVKQEGFFRTEVNADQLLTHLNTLGLNGWELTGTCETNGTQGRTNEIILFLKREL
jgi:Domain of unknown function (DUF4177)